MSKRNLDELFQEKFKDFKEVPDDRVWERIDATLGERKKNRKVIPFWWKLGGAAALLAVLFYVVAPFESPTDKTPVITDIETKSTGPAEQDSLDERTTGKGFPVLENPVAETETFSGEESKTNVPPHKDREVGPSPLKNLGEPKSQIVENGAKNNSSKTDREADRTGIQTPNREAERNATALVEKNTDQNNLREKDGDGNGKEKNTVQNILAPKEEEGLAETTLEKEKEEAQSPEKKSIFEEIAEKEEVQIADTDAKSEKWSIGAMVAPVYYNSLGEGSPIHPSFAANSKSGQVNMSYGLSVAYAVSKKISVRTGINKVDYGYATDDVEFSSSLNAVSGQIANIDYAPPSENVFMSSKANGNTFRPSMALDAITPENLSRAGSMSQQLGYVEVPVEMDYALLDKRFGINLVGGLSTLFLVDNSISLSSGELTTEIGSANNLNSVNFSTNVGLGVHYKLTPRVHLNVEPVFKYHLNTFTNSSGNFQPFTLGVYSGLNYRF